MPEFDANIRDYFAAHAPAAPDWWPQVAWRKRPYPPAPAAIEPLRKAHKPEYTEGSFLSDALEGAFEDEPWWPRELTDTVKAYWEADQKLQADFAAATLADRINREARWAFAWADGMLAARV